MCFSGAFASFCTNFAAFFVRFFAALPVHRDGRERAARRRRAARGGTIGGGRCLLSRVQLGHDSFRRQRGGTALF